MRVRVLLLGACLQLYGCFGLMGNESPQAVTIHTDRRSSSALLMDTSLEMDLNTKLQNLDLPTESRVYVKSFNRHILVLGQTPDEETIEKISEMVSSTEGVKKVYNEVSPMNCLSYWQKAKDNWITTKITSTMILTPKMNPWKIHVTTENSVVYLVGIVTPEEEEFAVNTAKMTSGVRKVVKLFDYKKSH